MNHAISMLSVVWLASLCVADSHKAKAQKKSARRWRSEREKLERRKRQISQYADHVIWLCDRQAVSETFKRNEVRV